MSINNDVNYEAKFHRVYLIENIDSSARLLVVDDHPENLIVLKAVFKKQGYQIETAEDGPSALKALDKFSYDLILLDIMMPGMDGFEVCRRIKAESSTKNTPVIFITAKTDFESVVQGYEIGAVDYVTKPFNPAILRARVKNQLKMYRVERDLQETVERLETEVAIRVLIEQELREREQELADFARVDGLTRIANRLKFDEYLLFQWDIQKRAQEPLTLIMSDIDFFKQFNDVYGHQAGDECLVLVAQALAKALHRPEDIACRYGGEEFSLILPHTPIEGAVHIADIVQKNLAEMKIHHCKSKVNEFVTLSMGVATIIPTNDSSIEALIKEADGNLYAAKHNGRNRVVS
ncbi:MAG: diguanylate cyclase [SAR324 cluster bacterium]|nr:diguanylate cyclase [SAR324 cluster bacterium]